MYYEFEVGTVKSISNIKFQFIKNISKIRNKPFKQIISVIHFHLYF